jgi:hypothetical protein
LIGHENWNRNKQENKMKKEKKIKNKSLFLSFPPKKRSVICQGMSVVTCGLPSNSRLAATGLKKRRFQTIKKKSTQGHTKMKKKNFLEEQQ